MSLVLNVEILGEYKKLTQATQGATSSLTGLNKKASAISKSMNKAFAAIGIGLSFRVLANELQDATQAAIEDRKSMDLLALAMKNTADATDDQIASAEKSITKLSIQAGVADDKLRPAYQKLFLATGDVTRSQDLLAIALDASAATGKDLDVVSQAMAKSLAGSDTALLKLIPSLKGSKNPMDDLAKAFDGAAAKAANLDPYQRMQVVFGEIQEKLGTALLPVLDKFAAWMATPKGQETLQAVADAASDVLTELTNTAKWAMENKDWLLPLVGAVGALGTIAKTVAGVTTAIKAAQVAMAAFNATTMLNPLVAAGASVAAILAIPSSGIQDYNGPSQPLYQVPNAPAVKPVPQPNTLGKSLGNQGVNITINTPKVTAAQITDLVNKAQKNGYTGMITIPRSR